MRILLLSAFLALAATSASADPVPGAAVRAHDSAKAAGPDSERVLEAGRVERAIAIDGVLDDGDWSRAAVATGFRQYEPVEGADPSQRTEVRVLYGEDAVYVGAVLYDSEPDRIERTLARRDDYNRADWFVVSIDSYRDRKTAYTFGVSAAGVQMDGITTYEVDRSWDAVWQSSVRMTPDGWVAEFRIPLSMLRFSEEGATWGINFRRFIPRTNETLEWALVPRTERRSGYVAQYGRLEGLTDLHTRRNVQILPYSVSRLDATPTDGGPYDASTGLDAGVDLKIGLTSNITLDATVNPDFGQVDADPAELNLTAFETRLRERRPFFVEGAQTLSFRLDFDGQLLYTRRIGAGEPVIGATKVTGRTDGGLNFGVLGAATGSDLDPDRLFLVARGRQQLGTYSSIGGLASAYNRSTQDARTRSLVAGTDWDIRFGGNRYQMDGFAAFTDRGGADLSNPETGFAGSLGMDRINGTWTWGAGVRLFSDGFNPNDVGQLRQRNYVRATLSGGYTVSGGRPLGPFQRGSIRMFAFQSWSYREGLDQGLGLTAWSNWTTRGFQDIELRVGSDYLFGGFDTYETRGFGPWAAPREFTIRTSFETDSRRSWTLQPSLDTELTDDGGHSFRTGLEAEWNAGSRLNLSAEIGLGMADDFTSWASHESFERTPDGWRIGSSRIAPDDVAEDDWQAFEAGADVEAAFAGLDPYDTEGRYFVPVFGRRDTRQADLTLRSNVTISPTFSIQFYGQLFAAKGHYDNLSVLRDAYTTAELPSYPKQHDFAWQSFQTNMVLRWEYRPGSTIYLVWSQARRGDLALDPFDLTTRSPFRTRSTDLLTDAFDIPADHAFMIKLNYLFLR